MSDDRPQDPFGRDDDERIAEYDVRSPMQRTLLVVAATVAVVLVLGGVVAVIAHLMRDTRTEHVTIDLSEVAQVRLESGAADLLLQPTDGAELEITATITDGLVKSGYELGRRGDTIVINGGCRSFLVPGCGIEVTIGVPSGFPVVVDTLTGDVAITELDGVVTVNSKSGDIEARRVSVVELSAFTTTGDVDVEFADQPYGFKARTTSGAVEALIPDGDITYNVSTTTQSGDIDSSIEHDDEGEGFITVETTSGDIALTSE